MRFTLTLFLFLGLFYTPYAKQVFFQRQYIGDKALLSYKWVDANNKTESIVVSLSKKDIARGNSEFKPFDNAKAHSASFQNVKKYAKQRSVGRKKIDISKTYSGFDITFHGISEAQAKVYEKGITKAQKQGFQNYLKQSFYTSYGNNNVMPNHRSIAKRYVTAMAPLAKLIKQKTKGQNRRQVINYILNFLQTIPYDELLNRKTSNGAGFQTPYGLLLNNRGDCDTKSVAMAAILRSIYPTQRIVMVYVPGHAFLGLHARPMAGDKAIILGGQPFVVADPTGPRQLELGEVAGIAKKSLANKNYSYQEVPF